MAGPTPDRYIPYTITTAAGTAITAPTNTPLNIELCHIVEARVLIPPGAAGRTGLQLVESGGVILPWGDPSSWVIGDNRDIPFTLNVQSSAQMFWRTYNLGNYPHTHYILLHVVDIAAPVLTLSSVPSITGMQG